jgi:ribosomal-protein-alanine N-acetyltransferase
MNLTTRRLALHPVVEEEAQPLHALWSSAGVRRFLWDDEIIPLSRTEAAIAESRRQFAERGHGLWCAWLAKPRELCGFGGIWPFRDPPELELLYGVAEPLWGQGYATEIAQGIVGHCFQSLSMSVVRASTDAENVASIHVLEKLKFDFVDRKTVASLDTVFYELKRHDEHVAGSSPSGA